VFVGPTYYQRLRHMAADKDHARSRGPLLMLSRWKGIEDVKYWLMNHQDV